MLRHRATAPPSSSGSSGSPTTPLSGFSLWPIAHAFEAARDTECFKFNVNLVLIDLFLRQGLIPPGPDAKRLWLGLDQRG